MKVPYSWLRTFFEPADVPGGAAPGNAAPFPEPRRLAELLDGLGLAVESVTEVPGAPEGTIVVDVRSVTPISGSDHLARTVVFDGSAEHVVVCGDQNIAVGMRTALVLPGTYLPAVDLTVLAREIRGVPSGGMLASAKELGLFEHGAGVLALGPDAPLGAKLVELWPAETVLELELTPNRADAFSLLGVARDVGAKLGLGVRHPAAGLALADPARDDGLTLDVHDPAAAPRFTLRKVSGVTVRPSPVWLQRRIAAVGLRPRNNVVDATNLITFELGQPNHAYDATVFERGHMVVRRARVGERLTLLNDEELALDPADLLITTTGPAGDVPLGLAGVMGGAYGGVEASTTELVLEAALFDPVTVRRAGQRHKVITDARTRFERGVDPNLQELASARLAQVIGEVAGGRPHPGITAFGADVRRAAVPYRPSRVRFLMDFDVPSDSQRAYLTALGCEVEERASDDWLVAPPSWRYDLALEEDVVEEVARVHGYEHIGMTEPDMRFVPPAGDPTHRRLRDRLAAAGLQETMTYVFTGAAELAKAAAPAPVVELASPQGTEKAVLRTALYPGLLAAAAANRAAGALALFEVGHVFGDVEEERVALLMRGDRVEGRWREGLAGDFFTLKGVIESLAGLEGALVETNPAAFAHLHPGVSAEVSWDGAVVGSAGRLHPAVAAAFELPEVYVAELRLPLGGKRVAFKEIVRQPYAERDLAVVVPVSVTYAALAAALREAAGEKLASLEPFDEYRGARLPLGSRSLALRFRFRDATRALTDAEVDALMENVIQAVRSAGYDIRA